MSHNKLIVMPGYWFMYNMYALACNAGKYASRDKRTDKSIFLNTTTVPDTVNEMFAGLEMMEQAVGSSLPAGKKPSSPQPPEPGRPLADPGSVEGRCRSVCGRHGEHGPQGSTAAVPRAWAIIPGICPLLRHFTDRAVYRRQ